MALLPAGLFASDVSAPYVRDAEAAGMEAQLNRLISFMAVSETPNIVDVTLAGAGDGHTFVTGLTGSEDAGPPDQSVPASEAVAFVVRQPEAGNLANGVSRILVDHDQDQVRAIEIAGAGAGHTFMVVVLLQVQQGLEVEGRRELAGRMRAASSGEVSETPAARREPSSMATRARRELERSRARAAGGENPLTALGRRGFGGLTPAAPKPAAPKPAPTPTPAPTENGNDDDGSEG